MREPFASRIGSATLLSVPDNMRDSGDVESDVRHHRFALGVRRISNGAAGTLERVRQFLGDRGDMSRSRTERPMPIQSAQNLLVHELQSICSAEMQAARALQAQLEDVDDEELSEMLERRLQEGERVLQDVQASLKRLDGASSKIQNKAAQGLIEEAEEIAEEVTSQEMKEAVIIAGAQKLEHYCIAAWGTVKAMATELGDEELAQAMQRALEEGYRWDEEMSDLAEGSINPTAIEAEAEEGSESSEKSK